MLNEAEELPRLADEFDRLAPGRGWGAITRGAYHVTRDEFTAASPWLSKALTDPGLEILLNVAAIWTAAKCPANAERVFRAVLARDPTIVAAQIGVAVSALARLDYMTPETTLRQVIQAPRANGRNTGCSPSVSAYTPLRLLARRACST